MINSDTVQGFAHFLPFQTEKRKVQYECSLELQQLVVNLMITCTCLSKAKAYIAACRWGLFLWICLLWVTVYTQLLGKKSESSCNILHVDLVHLHFHALFETMFLILTGIHTSYFPEVIKRQNLLDPATLHRSPILTKLVWMFTFIGSRPIIKYTLYSWPNTRYV